MKHLILLKFKKDVAFQEMIPDITNILDGLKDIEGIHDVQIYTNCTLRDNRHDIMVEIEMEKEVLPIYDDSLPHQLFKQKCGTLIEHKTIFDYE